MCKGEQKTTYGAARNELVKIFCELESDPVEIAFKWRFNNSKELISSSNVHTDGTRSCVTVVPHSEEDYGPIICWGKNSIGLQREPCVFQLIPAGKNFLRSSCGGRLGRVLFGNGAPQIF